MFDLSVFVIKKCHCFVFFLNVTVNAANVFPEVNFLDRLHHFFDGVLITFHRFYNLNSVVLKPWPTRLSGVAGQANFI